MKVLAKSQRGVGVLSGCSVDERKQKTHAAKGKLVLKIEI